LDDRPSPRRSGTITVWSRAGRWRAAPTCRRSPISRAAAHRGPLPPERTWMVAPLVVTSRVENVGAGYLRD
jgi:hypothetical protein